MEINVLILCGICLFLMILNCIEKWQSSKKEKELFDRLLLSNEEYLANRVRMSTTIKKPTYLGELDDKEEADEIPVD